MRSIDVKCCDNCPYMRKLLTGSFVCSNKETRGMIITEPMELHDRCELNISMKDYVRERIDDYQIRIDESKSITEQNVFRIIIEVYEDLIGGENDK